MPFRCDARNFFLTYPQSTDLPHATLHAHLVSTERVSYVYSCRERHADGAYHHHALVQCAQKFNCRNERYFDVEHGGRTFHCSIESCRDIGDSNVYIGKDGNTLGEPVPGAGARRRDLYATLLADANDSKTFMRLAEQRDARNFVLNHARLEDFAAKRWGRWNEPIAPDYPQESFTNVPDSLTEWVTNELHAGGARPRNYRPKNLILVGGAELGKTSWAESLGPHHYWVNRFTGARTANAGYAVLDDFDTLDQYKHDFKGVWGSQKRIGVKISNGVSGHKTWEWGIPSIWLYNRLPDCLEDPLSYERQRSELVHIYTPLF